MVNLVDRLTRNAMRVPKGILTRFRNFYRVRILRDPTAIANAEWFRVKGDDSFRLDYPLGRDSVVIDLGGYRGDWAAKIHSRYGCRIYVFEPVPTFCALIRRRFSGIPSVRAFEYGLAGAEAMISISLSEDSSSAYKQNEVGTVDIQLRSIGDFLRSEGLARVDLIKINIEGGEYELVRALIDSGDIAKFTDLQIQFHDFVPDAKSMREAIRRDLSKTHRLTYDFPFVWENWTILPK